MAVFIMEGGNLGSTKQTDEMSIYRQKSQTQGMKLKMPRAYSKCEARLRSWGIVINDDEIEEDMLMHRVSLNNTPSVAH